MWQKRRITRHLTRAKLFLNLGWIKQGERHLERAGDLIALVERQGETVGDDDLNLYFGLNHYACERV